jgi:phosphomannomutase
MKFVREESRPISGDSGLFDIRDLAADGRFTQPRGAGHCRPWIRARRT